MKITIDLPEDLIKPLIQAQFDNELVTVQTYIVAAINMFNCMAKQEKQGKKFGMGKQNDQYYSHELSTQFFVSAALSGTEWKPE